QSFQKICKGQHKKNLTDSDCTDSDYTNMVQHLLTKCTPSGKLHVRAADTVAEMFGCTLPTVRRIWKRASVDLSGNKTICDSIGQRKKGKSERKQLYTDLPQRIQTIPQSR
ncbi:hypothetical protein DYB25_013859, partial [Aphanomyces astaci]